MFLEQATQWILSALLILASVGVLAAPKPVHACLSFLLALMSLAALYLHLSAEFIALMQVLIYAGAILVIFMFVIVLFQDAHHQIDQFEAKSTPVILFIAVSTFFLTFVFLGKRLTGLNTMKQSLPTSFGSVEGLGSLLYLDYFFPFEAIVMLFLAALIGSVYVAKKEK